MLLVTGDLCISVPPSQFSCTEPIGLREPEQVKLSITYLLECLHDHLW